MPHHRYVGPSIPRCLRIALAAALAALAPSAAFAQIVTRLPTQDRVVALTFDACESRQPAALDQRVLAALRAHSVPFTVFMGGRFARDNATAVAALARDPQVEIENHSWSHPRDMRRLSDDAVRLEVTRAGEEIRARTGRKPRLFRFPGGNADARTVQVVERLGYKVVHWRFAEGDPDPHVSAKAMVRATLTSTRPGEILIFHINGRGVHTAEAIGPIIDGLKAQGYRFVRVSDYVPAKP